MFQRSSPWRTAIGHSARAALALVAFSLALLTVTSSPGGASVVEPRHTPTPQSPGIAVAHASFDLPDPYLLDAKGSYSLYLSTYLGGTQNAPVLRDVNGHWSRASVDAVPTLPSWAANAPTGLTWSPTVYRLGGTYVMYFAPTIQQSVQHCIALGTSASPTGPFTVQPNPLTCQRNFGGDIDAEMLVDKNGPDGPRHPNYLVWSSENDIAGEVAHVWAQPLSNDGRHLLGQPVQIFEPDQTWEASLVEAPQMALAPDGSVWLFFSAGTGEFSPNYGIGVVHCSSPLGPCRGGDAQPLLTSNKQGQGPGEETYFTAHDGSHWLLYNPWYAGVPVVPVRPVEAVRIGWTSFGPYLAAAGRFPPP